MIAEELEREPLRSPVDPHFEPYYQQVLQGNARAILRYCDEYWERGCLSDSFFELLGRLFVISFYDVAATILSNIARRRVAGLPRKQKVYEYWYRKVLKPKCDRARQFLRNAYRSDTHKRREELWPEYCLEPSWTLETEADRQYHEMRRQAVKELTEAHSSRESSFITMVNEFGGFGLVPKEIFFDLALTQVVSDHRVFRLTPAQVARKYACRITGISESTASHYKNVGK
ncbi:MAG: hypothetical protein WAU89_09580 [Candidatus Acidiferrales bacterium]